MFFAWIYRSCDVCKDFLFFFSSISFCESANYLNRTQRLQKCKLIMYSNVCRYWTFEIFTVSDSRTNIINSLCSSTILYDIWWLWFSLIYIDSFIEYHSFDGFPCISLILFHILFFIFLFLRDDSFELQNCYLSHHQNEVTELPIHEMTKKKEI